MFSIQFFFLNDPGSTLALLLIILNAYVYVYSIVKIYSRFYFIPRIFEKIRQYFGAQSESIPMSFVLGFYVSLIVKRWWEQYKLLPWPDTLALFISAAIPGNVSKLFCIIFCATSHRRQLPDQELAIIS